MSHEKKKESSDSPPSQCSASSFSLQKNESFSEPNFQNTKNTKTNTKINNQKIVLPMQNKYVDNLDNNVKKN